MIDAFLRLLNLSFARLRGPGILMEPWFRKRVGTATIGYAEIGTATGAAP